MVIESWHHLAVLALVLPLYIKVWIMSSKLEWPELVPSYEFSVSLLKKEPSN